MRTSLPYPDHADRETVTSTDYFWDNRTRPASPFLVVQRTVSGEAFFVADGVRHRVGSGQAMLFTHWENSAYGYPETATDPLVLEYVTLHPAAGLRELFDAVRNDFGSVVRMAPGGEAARWLDRLRAAVQGRPPQAWRGGEACFRLLLALHAEQQEMREAEDPVITLRRRLEEDFRQPIQIKQVAEECGRSREHLIRRFRERFETTPGAFLLRLRMEHAARLFVGSRLPRSAIVRNCGYAHTPSFVRAYRAFFGKVPPR